MKIRSVLKASYQQNSSCSVRATIYPRTLLIDHSNGENYVKG